MNERYLFRGKRHDTGEWIEGSYLDGSGMAEDWALICPQLNRMEKGEDKAHICGNFYFVNPQTLGQCTGLRDRNGTLIFEGDLIKLSETGVTASVIRTDIADEVELRYMCREKDSEWYGKFVTDGYGWHWNTENNCLYAEIIGNIHDNPEMLTKVGEVK